MVPAVLVVTYRENKVWEKNRRAEDKIYCMKSPGRFMKVGIVSII